MPLLPSLPVPTTALTTTRMGLMRPADSDLFKASDYDASFRILDAIPGTLPVANYAALPTGWTSAQHGTRVIQLDNGAEWYWYQPSGSGQWKRANSVGLLYGGSTNTDTSTTSVTAPGPSFITTGAFTAPGVRALRIDLRIGLDCSAGTNSIAIIQVKDSGNLLYEFNLRVGVNINGNGTEHTLPIFIQNPAPGSAHNISAYVRAANLSTAAGGHGTVVVRRAAITVCEV